MRGRPQRHPLFFRPRDRLQNRSQNRVARGHQARASPLVSQSQTNKHTENPTVDPTNQFASGIRLLGSLDLCGSQNFPPKSGRKPYRHDSVTTKRRNLWEYERLVYCNHVLAVQEDGTTMIYSGDLLTVRDTDHSTG